MILIDAVLFFFFFFFPKPPICFLNPGYMKEVLQCNVRVLFTNINGVGIPKLWQI